MKNYLILWLILTGVLYGVIYGLTLGWETLTLSSVAILYLASSIAAILVANEMRRPQAKEYYRKKALYPKIPDAYLTVNPTSGSIIFGKDHRTKKTVVAPPGKHCIIVGSTGSGKSSTSIIPTILTHKTGSAFIMDLKSRELSIKTSNIHDPNNIIVDLDHRAPYVHGWDVLYALKRDGTDTEQDALKVIRDISSIIIPKSTTGDQFWNDSARSLFTGLAIFEIVYQHNYELVDIAQSLLNIPLREHIDLALNTVQKDSIVASYLTGLANTADETLFSCDISMCQHLYFFVSPEASFALRDNVRRANPKMLDTDGTRIYLCVSEEQLDCGFDKIACIIIQQVLQELQARGTNSTYPECMLLIDEWLRLTESVELLRKATSSFLKTARSKHTSVILALQNLDAVDKSTIYDILSNVHFLYVLSSNNANSLTSEVVCKMAGEYFEKEKSITEGKGTSSSTSFREKAVLKPGDLNNLGEDAVLIITNHGYVRTHKEGTAYYKTEPYKSQYEKIMAVNREVMEGV